MLSLDVCVYGYRSLFFQYFAYQSLRIRIRARRLPTGFSAEADREQEQAAMLARMKARQAMRVNAGDSTGVRVFFLPGIRGGGRSPT